MGVFVTDDEYTEELADFTYQLVDLIIRHRVVAKRKANVLEQSACKCMAEAAVIEVSPSTSSRDPKPNIMEFFASRDMKHRKIEPSNSSLSTPVPEVQGMSRPVERASPESRIRSRTQHQIGQSLRRYIERADHDQSKCICGRQKRKQFKQCGVCYRNGNCQITKGKCKSCEGPCGPLFMYCTNCSYELMQ